MVKWRLHTHFEVDRSVPIRIDVTRRAGLWTGRKPTLRTYEMACFSFCRLASER